MPLTVAKAHAFGNDFLFVPREEVRESHRDLARAMCDRHHGIGGDGLILYSLGDRRATMTLLNADGSPSELSGNGLRCLAALVARAQRLSPGAVVTADTDAGVKTLKLLAVDGGRYTFEAALGPPETGADEQGVGPPDQIEHARRRIGLEFQLEGEQLRLRFAQLGDCRRRGDGMYIARPCRQS